jgi:F0F1-type ATP synthase assembly protein I
VRPAQDDNGARPPSPGSYAGLGLELAVPILILGYVGYKVDGWLDSSPWFFLLGALSGIAVAFYALFRRALPPKRPGGTV